MECFYINLSSEKKRALLLEDSFNAYKKSGWRLERVPALDKDVVFDQNIAGVSRPAEKACFLSHKRAIQNTLSKLDSHAFFLEDDCAFGVLTCEAVDRVIRDLNSVDWDMLFTDVGIFDVGAMEQLVRLRRQLVSSNELRALNLKGLPFFGSTAYIVNGKSKSKILRILESVRSLDVPYDIYLRQLIYSSQITAFVIFPFVTSLADSADSSNIQLERTKRTDLIYNLFRRMIWLEGRTPQYKLVLHEIWNSIDEDSKAFGTLWGAMVDKDFIAK